MESLFDDARARADRVQVAAADEGTAHFGIVVDGNYARPATDLEYAMAQDIHALIAAHEALNAWASRMPDAGFNSDDPRWDWWHERPR